MVTRNTLNWWIKYWKARLKHKGSDGPIWSSEATLCAGQKWNLILTIYRRTKVTFQFSHRHRLNTRSNFLASWKSHSRKMSPQQDSWEEDAKPTVLYFICPQPVQEKRCDKWGCEYCKWKQVPPTRMRRHNSIPGNYGVVNPHTFTSKVTVPV